LIATGRQPANPDQSNRRYLAEETSMNMRAPCIALLMSGLAAALAPSHPSLAQSIEAAAPNNTGAAAKDVAQTATMTTNKHRYWRHRGGRHPHYGSRRVRT
jgi:hypothetical protein